MTAPVSESEHLDIYTVKVVVWLTDGFGLILATEWANSHCWTAYGMAIKLRDNTESGLSLVILHIISQQPYISMALNKGDNRG